MSPVLILSCASNLLHISRRSTPSPPRTRSRSMMDCGGEAQREAHVHYNHTDPRSHLRWTARESYRYMYRRNWKVVSDFYSDVVQGRASLRDLFPTYQNLCSEGDEGGLKNSQKPGRMEEPRVNERGRWARVTFKIVLSYHGGSFDGWQKQPGLDTVQGVVERSLGGFVDEMKAKQLLEKGQAVEPCVVVAGRTDKGVTALKQVCSFYSWRKDIDTKDIMKSINDAAPGTLRALHVCKVSRVFHPNFSAKWRKYFYIFPLNDDEAWAITCSKNPVDDNEIFVESSELDIGNIDCSNITYDDEDQDAILMGLKPKSFCVEKVNNLLRQLEGKSLSYKMFARDTKASRNMGPATECFLFSARAVESRLPNSKECLDGQRVMCVELVANRFLRKMVRVIVATAVREAAAGCSSEALMSLMDATCRRATAPPAPPDGLSLVEVGYEEFSKENCLIP